MAIARLNGEVIAESTDTVLIEGNRYFPAHSVRAELLRPTVTRDDRHYYSIIVHDIPVQDHAWSVAGPSIPDPRIADYVAFDGPVEIED
jgi:uncharacterized protein (DUF427 family)